jgi:hypothetical protein
LKTPLTELFVRRQATADRGLPQVRRAHHKAASLRANDVCRTAQVGTRGEWHNGFTLAVVPRVPMLLMIGIGALVVTALASHLRGRRSVDPVALGWMSEQWLAEHRAMHRS